MMFNKSALAKIGAARIGAVGEHLIAADLMVNGCQVHMAEPGCSYDMVAELPNFGFQRVQVKATRAPIRADTRCVGVMGTYRFNARRGRNSRTRITGEHTDIMALVTLDTLAVAYLWMEEATTTIEFGADDPLDTGKRRGSRARRMANYTFEELVLRGRNRG